MSIQTLPSGRLRVQVYDPESGKNVSITRVLSRRELEDLGAIGGTFGPNQRKLAKRAREKARERLGERRSGVTVHEWWVRWTTDPLFARPKESTNLHNAERTKDFAEKHRETLLVDVDDQVVAAYLAGGRRNGRVNALRAMFSDAGKPTAGRLIPSNPFAGLGIDQGRGNADKQPPTEKQMWAMLEWAQRLCPPSFHDYLEFACFSGMRPGELDALQWSHIRWADHEVDVTIQWNAKAGKFTLPKYGPYTIALVGHARDTLLRAQSRRDCDSPFVFPTLRGNHYTPSTRTHHWNRVRAKTGMDESRTTLYLATKHYFGWYALNVLGLPAAIIAEQFGHKDGGDLVEQRYGHPDRRLRRSKLREAFDATAQVRPLRAIEGGRSA